MEFKRFLRVGLALIVSVLICPWVLGGGWAVVNIALLGSSAASHPELVDSIKKADRSSKEQQIKDVVNASGPKAAVYLSVIAFVLLGFVYGLIAGEWKAVGIVFIATLLLANPALFKVPLSTGARILLLILQLVLLYGSAYIFSRTFRAKKA